MSQVVGLPHNSYKPITNTAWIRARLCKLQIGCTRFAAASDKVYQLLAHGRWFSPGTPASSTTKAGRHDIAKHQQSINQSINRTDKKYVVVIIIYAHSYLFNKEERLKRIPCNSNYSLKYNLIECVDVADKSQRKPKVQSRIGESRNITNIAQRRHRTSTQIQHLFSLDILQHPQFICLFTNVADYTILTFFKGNKCICTEQ